MTRARDLADSADKDIAGTLTLDGLTVDGVPTTIDDNRIIFNETPSAGSLGSRIVWRNPATTYDYASIGFDNQAGSSGGLRFKTASSVFSDTDKLRMDIADDGDISFYEDTGTTPKFFWDASASSLGIGTSSPQRSLSIGTHGTSSSAEIAFGTTSTGYASLLFGDGTTGTSLYDGYIQYQHNGGNMLFATGGGSERMRIDSSGAVAIGDSNPTRHGQTTKTLIYNGSGTAAHAALHCSRNGTGTEFQVAFSNAYGVRGTITTTASAVAYNTTSDYRLKENVTDVTDGITRLKQLAPKRFNFIVDPDKTVDGFIAHEAQAVVPEAVTGTQDAMRDEEYEVTPAVLDDDGNVVTEAVMGTRSVPDYQGIDQAKLVPLLTAALQEAIAKIETLETKVAALEGA